MASKEVTYRSQPAPDLEVAMKFFTYFRRPRGLRTQAWALTRLFRNVLRTLAKRKVFNVTVINREAVPRKGKVIIACNHISVSDPVFLWGAVRRNAVALAMAELWRMPGINALMWGLGHIPVNRGDAESGQKALAAGEQVLKHDGVLFIFPEGKCSRDGELLDFKPGVALLALKTGAPVLPVGIIGSDRVRPLKSKRVHRKEPVRLKFGTLIDPKSYAGPNRVDDLLADIRRQMVELTRA